MEGALASWLQDALMPQSELKGFAKGLEGNFEAVNQTVTAAQTTGRKVNRLKNIKRWMFGRSGFQLLRQIVLFNSGDSKFDEEPKMDRNLHFVSCLDSN